MSTLTEIIQRLQERKPLPALCPKEIWDPALSEQIHSLSDQEITGRDHPSLLSAQLTRAGLLLWNDDLDGSHAVSQQISEPLGSYWHGIMHRREGDFNNSKYWFSNVGKSEIYSELYKHGCEIAPELESWGEWKPERFIDWVELAESASASMSAEEMERIKEIQVLEFSLVLQRSTEV